jgi:ABC-type nitrate/sulfonate/bicarbonate transport system ATPase subunit
MQIEAEAPTTEPLSVRDTGIVLSRVERRYRLRRRREVTALSGLDLEVRPAEVVAVVGPSGCGKSTLLELVAGLAQPDAGAVAAVGRADAPGRRAACAYMPQRDLLLPWRDALANAALALECQGVARAEARRRAEPLFERFGLARFERSYPAALSGGMRQRVAFLRTLLAGRPVLLLDEPFGALDEQTRLFLGFELLRIVEETAAAALLVTHSIQEAVTLSDEVVVMTARPGRVKSRFVVDLPRPRTPEVLGLERTSQLVSAIWGDLRSEASRAMKEGALR